MDDELSHIGGSTHGAIRQGAKVTGDWGPYKAILDSLSDADEVGKITEKCTKFARKTAAKSLKEAITDRFTVDWEAAQERSKIRIDSDKDQIFVHLQGRSLQLSRYNITTRQDTTGRNRRPISAQLYKGGEWKHPLRTGFVWQGRVHKRPDIAQGRAARRSFQTVYTLSLPQLATDNNVNERVMQQTLNVFLEKMKEELDIQAARLGL